MKTLVLTAVSLLALTGLAIFPPMVGGDFEFHVQPVYEVDADGIPIAPAPKSVSLLGDPGLELLACADTPDPSLMYSITVKVTATGQRQGFRAYAYSEPGCQGLRSDPSENIAFTYPGMKPTKPTLEP